MLVSMDEDDVLAVFLVCLAQVIRLEELNIEGLMWYSCGGMS
jgi:hypothetical protein